ncbi:hypothetical protein GGTG_03049 [Gaeumannomyces tritici R3-111a-1]|uniref:Uncharacterized protein n=1 Tax=Gaeumannomyces tritici (strain R3-111a-1) TaxID=644352 RepID=J3NP43_GAET3|nr:hypothetical protein GGTG_03049 [Gaeumannomyces tritici R3-111a-1]EJT77946.1 hypothetical protein GGTG_03049 [Gaeumannomyces tritici R3-111a-1]
MGKSISPGGALLRSSRMFSLPAPLKPPKNNVTTATQNLSFSATTPYPTLQTVTTPSTSRSRGDWGFKRPLPLKSTTKSSTPLIRVRQVDSSEQVTDFASAADHTLTLQKFQEMNIPVLIPQHTRIAHQNSTISLPTTSVFEEEFDSTVMDATRARLLRDKRWRFSGPWLAGMAEGEFENYLKRKVAPRRSEFRWWLRKDIAAEKNKVAAAEAIDAGNTGADVPRVKPEDISSAELTEELRKLREDRPKLFKAVGEFLDLAPIQQKGVIFAELTQGKEIRAPESLGNPYAEQGPPVTHPSAGISYLRTSAFVENHPVYGPQAYRRHVRARMLSIANTAANAKILSSGKIGVGGFVTDSPQSKYDAPGKKNRLGFDHTIVGGRKMYVEPHSAVVDAKGNVKINSITGTWTPMAAFVAKQLDGEDVSGPIQQEDNLMRRREITRALPVRVREDADSVGSAQSYGFYGARADFASRKTSTEPEKPRWS